MRRIKVLFVCLGNICRSPLAEAIFRQKVVEKGLSDYIEADSCGTSNYHIGDTADPRTLRNAKQNGVDITHVGRQLCTHDLEAFDYVLAMDSSNYQNIFLLENASHHADKIMMMRRFDDIEIGGDVPDPYFGGEKGFQDVFEILDRSTENFIEFLKENHLIN